MPRVLRGLRIRCCIEMSMSFSLVHGQAGFALQVRAGIAAAVCDPRSVGRVVRVIRLVRIVKLYKAVPHAMRWASYGSLDAF